VIQWRLQMFESLESTSDFCVALAKAGTAEGLAVLAARQTAGRGSRGREWLAPPGNVNLSVLLRPQQPAALSGMFSLLAGIAVAEAVNMFLPPSSQATLKWPNDVLIGAEKLAGILIDAAPKGNRLDWLVIGIGINALHAPIIGRATTTLHAHGGDAAAPAIAAAVLARLGARLEDLQTSGPAAIRDAWLANAHPQGTKIDIRTAQGSISGSFAGLSESGALLLSRGDTVQRIDTGEIMLGIPCFSS
jgi:BirA family biotin operon repressor/biotin-[acetyl-CoA-carboxylase] ligase